jgi:hypothetical protein
MPSPVLSLYDVLVEEYASQGLQPPVPRADFEARRGRYEAALAGTCEPGSEEFGRQLDAAMVKDFYSWLHGSGVRRSALCFSGGGIRSATFGLGIVQGLARNGLLKQFDFLSTVSGGGYLGSWLSGWIERVRRQSRPEEKKPEEESRSPVQLVEDQLRRQPTSPIDPEPQPVQYLRRFSRYMSPKAGLLSADTWTLVAIFLRNLFLNWLVLLPLMAAGLMVPRASVILLRLGTRPWFQAHEGWILPAVFWVSVLLGSIAIAYISANRSGIEEHRAVPWRLRGQKWFLILCLLPLYLMSVLISLDWGWLRSTAEPLSALRLHALGWVIHPALAFVLFGVLVHLGGFLLARIWVRNYVPGELAVIMLTGALGGGAAWLAASYIFPTVVATLARPHLNTVLASELYVCFASPLLLLIFLLAATLFVGLSSYYTNDADREWLARAGAWVLIAVAVRSAFSGIVIFGPDLLARGAAWVASLGGISGLVTLVLGRSAKTRVAPSPAPKAQGEKTPSLLDLALSLAAPVFALFILMVLSLATTLLVRWAAHRLQPEVVWPAQNWGPGRVSMLMDVVYGSPWLSLTLVFLALVAVGGLMGWFVDINRFSLHAAYRDRLIRAYMGASRGAKRRPHPFTGFDEDDNFQMREMRGNRPFHVVNMALNLVAGKDLAWQDRKAETFTSSALHAGSFRLGYRDVAEYGLHRNKKYALSLGTSMAISGAAASPNMGYHSSPVVTFLLALFNVRLGWWLGNPGRAGDKTYATPGPRFAPSALFAEAFGLTDSEHPYVYLSDGGHFENLGLYEMILRRCHFVVVSDGGQDPDFTFEDLGNALSKIRVDLGVPVRFERILMRPRPADPEIYDVRSEKQKGEGGQEKEITQPYCALARICYSCVDSLPPGMMEDERKAAVEAMDGWLLYIKASLNGTEPADVFHYARLHSLFPHESTANQLYTESQFESYRELGSHAMKSILKGLPAETTLEALFDKIGDELGRPGCD